LGRVSTKKSEARNHSDLVDFALTFEELAAMLTGKGIDIDTIADSGFQSAASGTGNGFACAGGVAKAVQAAVAGLEPLAAVISHNAAGLENCAEVLTQIQSGRLKANFLEGMACYGGCIGGPGGLANVRVASKLVDNFAKQSTAKNALDNGPAQTDSEKPGHWHRQSKQ